VIDFGESGLSIDTTKMMKKSLCMGILLGVIFLPPVEFASGQSRKPQSADISRLSLDERRELAEIRRRFSDPKYAELLTGMSYALIHAGASEEELTAISDCVFRLKVV
jgi:hypothetical protein